MRSAAEPAPAAPGTARLLAQAARSRLAGRQLPRWAIPLAVAAVSVLAFAPALDNDFVAWDDDVNLLDNPSYRGLGWTQIRWMFTSTLAGHYIPVTWLSFGLDWALWGMNPFGYHLTNVLLHAANAALFYLVATRVLARATSLAGLPLRVSGALAALFFAVHPLRVESVAWATERRDVLSGLFFLVTLLLYLRAAEATGRARRWSLAASVASYALALLSKSIVMTLPLILLLLDVYPLGRLAWRRGAPRDAAARRILEEKLPYLALAVAGAITSYWAVSSNHFLTSTEQYGWPARIAMAGYSLWFYLEKTAWPIGLSPLHELPAAVNPLEARFLLSALAAVAVGAGLFARRRRWPAGLAVGAAYAITLGPVTGLVHSGHQLAHDRYSYLSCLGWALLVGAAVGVLVRAAATGALRPWFARAAAGAAAVWILALGALTWSQVQVWRDTQTLWRHAVEADPTCSLCQAYLGESLYRQGLLAQAKDRYELALALRPDKRRLHSGLGLILLKMGQVDRAMSHLQIAIERYPNDPDVIAAMAFALLTRRRLEEAIPLLERAVRINPEYFQGHANLGAAYTDTGRPGKGLAHLRRAIELRPDDPAPRLSLTGTYLALGNVEAAREEYKVLVGLHPRLAGGPLPAYAPHR